MPQPQARRGTKRTEGRTCYYELLGVVKTSDDQEIKKAYRRLALKWHPDKNPHNKDEAEQMFKRISEAYEVLSDNSKRQVYDRYGHAGLKNGVTTGHTNFDDYFTSDQGFSHFNFRSPFDVFREFFGGRDPFQDFFRQDPFVGDFFSFPDPFEDFFAGPVTRKPDENVSRYEGGANGYFQSHYHFDPFSDIQDTDNGFSSTIRFSSGEPGKNAAVQKTSKSTKLVNGKKVVIKKTEEAGNHTIEVTENGKLKSLTVNGQNQAIE